MTTHYYRLAFGHGKTPDAAIQMAIRKASQPWPKGPWPAIKGFLIVVGLALILAGLLSILVGRLFP